MPLISKGTPRPAQARLDFVCNQGRAIVAGQLTSARPKGRTYRIDAALSLDRFDHHGANRIVEFRLEVRDIVETQEFDSGQKRGKWLTVFCGMSYRESAEGPPVERILQRQNARFSFRSALVRRKPRQFERAFNRFRAAIGEKHALQPRPLGQLAR